jgi:Fic/DOC family N-terminal
MNRGTGTYDISTTQGEPVRAFVPHPLPPARPALAPDLYADLNRQAELALARLAGVSGLVPSVDWLLYSAIRKEALLTSQIEVTQATLTDLFDKEAGFKVSNPDDVEEVTNYLRAFRWVQEELRDPQGRPCELPLVRDATDDAALHHRACSSAAGHEFSDGDGGGQGAGRSGHRGRNDGP